MRVISILFISLIATLLLYSTNSVAQAAISIHHAPLNPKDLPDPGSPLTIKVAIANTKDVDLRLFGIFTLDGHLVTVPTTRAELNRYDEAVYELEIPAPISSMSYEFILYPPDGAPIVSARYGANRPCTPRSLEQFADLDSITDGSERMRLLIEKSQSLNFEIERYERVLSMIAEIESLKGEDS